MKTTVKKSARNRRKRSYRPEYFTPAYQNFVTIVRKRDGMRCQFPGCKKRKFGIEVHHIIRWDDNHSMRYNPSNGICLCYKCHKMVTGKEASYARLFFNIVQTNTKKQFERERSKDNG